LSDRPQVSVIDERVFEVRSQPEVTKLDVITGDGIWFPPQL
jgi:hypothetical protein